MVCQIVLTLLSKAVSQCQFIYMAEMERVDMKTIRAAVAGAVSSSGNLAPNPSREGSNDPFGNDPDDEGNDGGNNDEEEKLVLDESPTTERDIVDSRALHNAKLEPVPNTAADFRPCKNGLILLTSRLDVSGFDYLTTWISHAFKVHTSELCAACSDFVPRLDRWLASELMKNLKGVPDLQFKVQGYVERCTYSGVAPRGRAVLQMVSRHFDLDHVRGSLITSQSIFQVELSGFAVSDLQEFSSQVMKMPNSIPQEQWPRECLVSSCFTSSAQFVALRELDEIKRSPEISPLRDFDYLRGRWQKFLVEEREDVNARSIEQSLKSPKRSQPTKPRTPAVPAKAVPKAASPSTPAAPAVGPGLSKPKDGGPKSPPRNAKEKAKGKRSPMKRKQRLHAYSINFRQVACTVRSVFIVTPKAPPPKKAVPKTKQDSKAKPKPAFVPKIPAAVAIIAALSSVVAPSQSLGTFEWFADTGAGRHI